jgi:hypothetical protein
MLAERTWVIRLAPCSLGDSQTVPHDVALVRPGRNRRGDEPGRKAVRAGAVDGVAGGPIERGEGLPQLRTDADHDHGTMGRGRERL